MLGVVCRFKPEEVLRTDGLESNRINRDQQEHRYESQSLPDDANSTCHLGAFLRMGDHPEKSPIPFADGFSGDGEPDAGEFETLVNIVRVNFQDIHMPKNIRFGKWKCYIPNKYHIHLVLAIGIKATKEAIRREEDILKELNATSLTKSEKDILIVSDIPWYDFCIEDLCTW